MHCKPLIIINVYTFTEIKYLCIYIHSYVLDECYNNNNRVMYCSILVTDSYVMLYNRLLAAMYMTNQSSGLYHIVLGVGEI